MDSETGDTEKKMWSWKQRLEVCCHKPRNTRDAGNHQKVEEKRAFGGSMAPWDTLGFCCSRPTKFVILHYSSPRKVMQGSLSTLRIKGGCKEWSCGRGGAIPRKGRPRARQSLGEHYTSDIWFPPLSKVWFCMTFIFSFLFKKKKYSKIIRIVQWILVYPSPRFINCYYFAFFFFARFSLRNHGKDKG